MITIDMQCVTSGAGEGSGRGIMHGHMPLSPPNYWGYWGLPGSNLVATPMCLELNDIMKIAGDESQHLTELTDQV